MRRVRHCAIISLLMLLGGFRGPALAGSLSSDLHRFIGFNITPLDVDVVEPISPIVQRVAIRGTDFPVTSTTPGFTYSYNPELLVFERSSKSLGTAFLERAETTGRGRFDVGLSYLYADLIDEDGENFAEEIFLGSNVNVQGVNVAGAFRGTDFSLQSHAFYPFVTYGVTDRWDVNLVVPLVYTILELETLTAAAIEGGAPQLGQFKFSDFFDNDAFGVGDILLRTKYRFLEHAAVDLAGGLSLRFPSGEEDDFHGLGDWTVTPSLVMSRVFGQHEVYGMLGIETNADDLERSRARYGIGGALQLMEQLAFVVDFLGSSSFVDDEFSIPKQGAVVPAFTLLPSEFVKADLPNEVVAFVPRSDVVDVAAGFKVSIAGRAVAYLGAIVPLTDDSLRAEVIPTGGIEFTF